MANATSPTITPNHSVPKRMISVATAAPLFVMSSSVWQSAWMLPSATPRPPGVSSTRARQRRDRQDERRVQQQARRAAPARGRPA